MGHRHDTSALTAAAASSTGAARSAAASATTSTHGAAQTCPALRSPVNDAAPIAGSVTFQHLSEYIAAACAGVATILALMLIIRHAMHLSRPREQIKIMRITALIPVFGLVSLGSIFLGTSAIYITPWMNVCESIALMNFFLLIRAYLYAAHVEDNFVPMNLVGRNPQGSEASVDPSTKEEATPAKPPPPAWRVRIWALQYVVVAFFCAVLTDITQTVGKYCLNSDSWHFAHFWVCGLAALPKYLQREDHMLTMLSKVGIIRSTSVALAVMAVLRFTNLNKQHMSQHKPMIKLLAFKLIVFLDVVQGLIFSYAGNHITPTSKLSYNDLTVGLPALILSAEMVIFSVVFHFVYRATPYEEGGSSRSGYHGGPLGVVAIFKAFNPISVVADIVKGY